MKRYGLIGYPLTHSFSKLFFEKKFSDENITDTCFDLLPMSDLNGFREYIQSHKELMGLAVTIPHKKNIIPFLSELDETARQVGAVNCIRIRDGHTLGFNTDVVGFEHTLMALDAGHHRFAMVLGTGGASACVQYVLKKLGIDFVVVGREHQNELNNLLYTGLTEAHMRQCTLIINTTPLGMSPNVDTCPDIPFIFMDSQHMLIDLVYNPEVTLFMQKGIERGARVTNGHLMFTIQAEQNWRVWNS